MKTAFLILVASMTSLLSAQAQYKGPRDYFPKNNSVPGVTNPATARTPGQQGSTTPAAPAKTSSPKFQDLPLNSQFYFISDTNRTYSWTKLTATTAKNTKNGVTTSIKGETPVQK